MSVTPGPVRRPWMPRLFLGALAILLLSWLVFMIQYVRRVASQPRSEPAPHEQQAGMTNRSRSGR